MYSHVHRFNMWRNPKLDTPVPDTVAKLLIVPSCPGPLFGSSFQSDAVRQDGGPVATSPIKPKYLPLPPPVPFISTIFSLQHCVVFSSFSTVLFYFLFSVFLSQTTTSHTHTHTHTLL